MEVSGPQSRSGRGGEEKNSQPLPGIEPKNFDRPAHSPALYRLSYYGSPSELKGFFLKKDIYSKYTKTKLRLLFNVIPLDFNAPVPAFHGFLNSVRKKKFSGCVFNQFCQIFLTNRHHT
jgi:hypothetical protein